MAERGEGGQISVFAGCGKRGRERSVWRAVRASRGGRGNALRVSCGEEGGELEIQREVGCTEVSEEKVARGRLYRALSMFSKVASACSKNPSTMPLLKSRSSSSSSISIICSKVGMSISSPVGSICESGLDWQDD